MGLLDRFRRPKAHGPAAVSAMAKRRLRGWNPPLENINALVASGGPRLLARSRELVVSNGCAANACEAFAANLVGDGIKPSSLIEDPSVRDRVQRLWLAWTDEADADGLTDFYGLQAMVAREMFVAGECFARLRPRRAEDGLAVPLQLQLLQSEMLPFEKTETAASGNPIRCGIEFDAIGRRVAYHVRRRHPGDSTDRGEVIPETVRVPAEDVLHVYRPIDAGQIRGLPHIPPAMVRLFLLDQYDDAELDRKKTAAMFAGFITKTAPEEPMMGEAEADPDGAAIASLEPGTMQVLLPGEDVKFSSPTDVGGGYEAFQYRTLLAVPRPPAYRPTLRRSAPRRSPMPAPLSTSVASPGCRRWPAASSRRTPASTRSARRCLQRRPRLVPRSAPATRSLAARPAPAPGARSSPAPSA
jgi:lambda family phage portal protein